MDGDTTRSILAENLRRMIDGEGLSIRALALSRGLDMRLIDRLVNKSNAVTIDTLEVVAEKLGLQAWQLLLPDLDPKQPPDAPISEEDRKMIAKLRRLLGD